MKKLLNDQEVNCCNLEAKVGGKWGKSVVKNLQNVEWGGCVQISNVNKTDELDAKVKCGEFLS